MHTRWAAQVRANVFVLSGALAPLVGCTPSGLRRLPCAILTTAESTAEAFRARACSAMLA